MENLPLIGIAAIFLMVFAKPCHADSYENFIHITCIPEARYLAFEVKDIEIGSVLMEAEFDEKMREKRMESWKRHGYFDPSNLDFECNLPESHYKIVAAQPAPSERGRCGASPQITLTLTRNGKPFIENVVFGDECSGDASLYSVEISDGLAGLGGRKMKICASPGFQRCNVFSERHQKITQSIPIDKEKLFKYFKNKY